LYPYRIYASWTFLQKGTNQHKKPNTTHERKLERSEWTDGNELEWNLSVIASDFLLLDILSQL